MFPGSRRSRAYCAALRVIISFKTKTMFRAADGDRENCLELDPLIK